MWYRQHYTRVQRAQKTIWTKIVRRSYARENVRHTKDNTNDNNNKNKKEVKLSHTIAIHATLHNKQINEMRKRVTLVLCMAVRCIHIRRIVPVWYIYCSTVVDYRRLSVEPSFSIKIGMLRAMNRTTVSIKAIQWIKNKKVEKRQRTNGPRTEKIKCNFISRTTAKQTAPTKTYLLPFNIVDSPVQWD